MTVTAENSPSPKGKRGRAAEHQPGRPRGDPVREPLLGLAQHDPGGIEAHDPADVPRLVGQERPGSAADVQQLVLGSQVEHLGDDLVHARVTDRLELRERPAHRPVEAEALRPARGEQRELQVLSRTTWGPQVLAPLCRLRVTRAGSGGRRARDDDHAARRRMAILPGTPARVGLASGSARSRRPGYGPRVIASRSIARIPSRSLRKSRSDLIILRLARRLTTCRSRNNTKVSIRVTTRRRHPSLRPMSPSDSSSSAPSASQRRATVAIRVTGPWRVAKTRLYTCDVQGVAGEHGRGERGSAILTQLRPGDPRSCSRTVTPDRSQVAQRVNGRCVMARQAADAAEPSRGPARLHQQPAPSRSPPMQLGHQRDDGATALSGLYRRTGCVNAAQAAYRLGQGDLAGRGQRVA